MALTLSGTNGVVGAGFTLDPSGASVTAGVGTFGSVASSGAISGTAISGTTGTFSSTGSFSDQLTVASGSDNTRGLRVTGGASGGTEIAQFRTNNGTVRFTVNNNVTLNSGNLVVATSGAGIDFSATGDGSGTDTSELLDDYEEGTWTPTITGGAITTNGAYYTKIGRTVHWYLYGTITNTANDGATFKIYGLPYTVGGNSTGLSNYYGNVGSANYTGSANNAGLQRLGVLAHGATDYVYFHFIGAGDTNPPVNSYFHSHLLNQGFIISGVYFV